jgi:membrane-bound lytic murein transglycosylase A
VNQHKPIRQTVQIDGMQPAAAATSPAYVRSNARSVAAFVLALAGLMLNACRTVPMPPAPATPVATPPPVVRFEQAVWEALPGWHEDDIAQAWPALMASCNAPRMPAAWAAFCRAAAQVAPRDSAAQRTLVMSMLRAYRVVTETRDARPERRDTGMITGYYEPVLKGARKRGGAYQTPLYAVPEDLVTVELGDLYPALKGERIRGRLQGRRVTPYPDRAELTDGKLLAGREIVWVDSAIDAFFLQIQGSGRVQLEEGTTVRLAFADVNGHPYRAIGRYLVERGELTLEQATMPGLRQWLSLHPERQAEVFNTNPSMVFFREEKIGDPAIGPRGSLNVPLTAERSLAIDPRLLPLGAPFFLATTHPLTGAALQRMVVGQDTGGAIRGALRADLFWGLGPQAGDAAGRMRQDGALWLLWPADQPLPVPAP